MRDCPKCGSYVPEGKLLCPVCGRLSIGLSASASDRVRSERKQTHTRISNGFREVLRDAPLQKRGNHPYAGGTYEQHKSHDPNNRDCYRPRYETSSSDQSLNQRILCAAAYFGIFFVIPLIALPYSKEAKFHANQGLVLLIFNVLLGMVVGTVSSLFGDVFDILNVIYPLLMVYGASNAMKGKQTELPVIGKLRLIKDDSSFGGFR